MTVKEIFVICLFAFIMFGSIASGIVNGLLGLVMFWTISAGIGVLVVGFILSVLYDDPK